MQRFWDKVDKLGPIPKHCPELGNCWVWTASTRNQYGAFKMNGEVHGAHRVSFEEHHKRRVQDGLFVCHHCDNPPCVKPSHLFEGTRSDNMIDAYQKGRVQHPVGIGVRFKSGDESFNGIGVERATAFVRDILSRGDRTYRQIADLHGRKVSNVNDVLRGRSYVRIVEALTRDANVSDGGSLPPTSSTKEHKGVN